MTLTPVPVNEFRGLDLRADMEDVGFGGAQECLNVDVSRQDVISQRPGTDTLISRPGIAPSVIGQRASDFVIAWGDNTVKSYSNDGLEIDSVNVHTGGFATMGEPGAEVVYFGDTTDGLYAWDGAAFSIVNGTYKPYLVTESAMSNRLIIARFDGTGDGNGVESVRFSGAGNPENFAVNGYVDLDPGDGEPITNLVTWRDLVFAFKRSKFYVFYGESLTNTGTAAFNYRKVDVGIGATAGFGTIKNRSATACAAPDGVYFLADDGVYITTGDAPVKVSGELDPWFRGDTLVSASTPAYNSDFTGASVAADARYLYVQPGSDCTFARSFATGQWTVFDQRIFGFRRPGSEDSPVQSSLLGLEGKVVKQNVSYLDDDGTAIPVVYRSGASDLGDPMVKVVRRCQAWGAGAVTLSVFTDHATTDAGASALTLGTAPAVTRDVQSYSRSGTFFSYQVEADGPVRVHRLSLDVRESRLAGVG